MPRTGLRQRANRRRPRVLTGPGAALSIRRESKPGADHDLQPQDARVPRWVWIVGLRNRTIRYAAPLVRGFERQSVHGGSDPAETREQTRPEVHLHGFRTDAGGDQAQVAIWKVECFRLEQAMTTEHERRAEATCPRGSTTATHRWRWRGLSA